MSVEKQQGLGVHYLADMQLQQQGSSIHTPLQAEAVGQCNLLVCVPCWRLHTAAYDAGKVRQARLTGMLRIDLGEQTAHLPCSYLAATHKLES